MRKIISLLLACIMLVSLVACGGSGGRADEAYVGKWVSVAGSAMGITLTGEDISGFEINLESEGKGKISVDGDEGKIKWINDDTTLTITVEGEELVADIGEDILVFTDFMGLGMDLTFAKEGSEAAKPENVLPENEKAMIGTWTSNAVTDVLGDDASAEIAADALTMTFNADHTCDIEFNGEAITGQAWAMLDNWGYLEDSEYDISWEMTDGEISVTYNGEDYWIFSCAK